MDKSKNLDEVINVIAFCNCIGLASTSTKVGIIRSELAVLPIRTGTGYALAVTTKLAK